MRPMTLEQWDADVGRHLQMIEAGAEIVARHARALAGMPEWQTRAMDELQLAERIMSRALVRLATARQILENKPRVG